MLSAIVLTKNEERNINGCLKSLFWCDEIIVIDDYSEDKTIKKIQNSKFKIQNYNLKLKIFQRCLNGDFAAQRNFGLKKAKGDWILFIDADERISAELADEIVSSTQHPASSIKGFYLRRKDKFLGKWLRYGETSHVKLLRLARRDVGRWKGKVHEVWQIKGETKILENPLLHKRDLMIGEFLSRINCYSSLRASQLYNEGITTNIFLITLYPSAKFFQNYFFRLGFLDGVQGFILAMMMSLHSFLVRGKLWVRQRNQGREEFKISDWENIS